MAYPTDLDSLSGTRGTNSDPLNSPNHVTHHTAEDTAIEALEAKVGIDGSAVTTSHDYKLSGVTGSDKAVSKTGTETLTNKTLTSPVINVTSDATGDLYYRSSGGAFTRLPIGSNTNILAVSSGGLPEWIANPDTSNATTTTSGIVELATQAQVDAGTDAGTSGATNVVTPSTVRGKLYHDYAASSSGNDTYAITVTPAPTAYTTGDVYVFEPDTANTGAASLNVNTLGAKTIVRADGSTLSDGDIAAGGIHTVVYDGTNMILQNPLQINKSSYACGTSSYSTSSGNGDLTIAHGLGATPQLIRISCTTNSTHSNQVNGGCTGVATGTSDEYSISFQDNASASITSSTIISLRSSTGSEIVSGNLTTLDSTNIVIALTFTAKTGDGTTKVMWEAIA